MKRKIDQHEFNTKLPNGALYLVMPYLEKHKVHLTITPQRKTILGNYYFDKIIKQHKITVNGNLNPYAFLITLLHELAHLITFEQHHNKVLPHGDEWKINFQNIVHQFITAQIFPDDIEAQLYRSMQQVKASSCADILLYKVLEKYNLHQDQKQNLMDIAHVPVHAFFMYENKRFQMIKKRRTRYQCLDTQSQAMYLFSPICQVSLCS